MRGGVRSLPGDSRPSPRIRRRNLKSSRVRAWFAITVLLFAGTLQGCQEPTVTHSPHSPAAVAATPAAPELLSQLQFCRLAADRVLQAKPKWRLKEASSIPLVILTEGECRLEVRLDRLYDFYRKDPAQLESLLKDGEKGLIGTARSADLKLTWRVAREYLMPRLVPSEYLQDKPSGLRPTHRPWSKGLVVVYYFDRPEAPTRILITPDIVREWKVSLEKVHSQALQNLEKLSPVTIEQEVQQPVGTIYFVSPDDDYGASRILLPSTLDKLAAAAGGDVRLWMPTRELLWGVRRDNQKGAECLSQLSGNLTREATEPLCDRAFLYQRGQHRLVPLSGDK